MQEAAAVQITANPFAVAAFIGYLGVIVMIGVLSAKFSSGGVSESFVGGRKMHRFVVALSAVVSGRSAWLLLGVTGMATAIPNAIASIVRTPTAQPGRRPSRPSSGGPSSWRLEPVIVPTSLGDALRKETLPSRYILTLECM